jgi:hypothetical protein
MAEEFELKNDLTGFGLRRIQVMSMGEPVNPENWLPMVAPDASDLQLIKSYDDDLDIHYLWLVWHAREPVMMQLDQDSVRSVLWWIYPKDCGIAWAADLAAGYYKQVYGDWPGRIMTRNLPTNAKEEIEASFLKNDQVFKAVIPISADRRVPEGFVVAL